MVITFPYTFRFDTDELYSASFSLDLSSQEIADIKRFIQDNHGLPFWAMDYDYPDLFDKMMEAHQHAIVEGINAVKKGQGEPLISADNIDWESISTGLVYSKNCLSERQPRRHHVDTIHPDGLEPVLD